MKRVKKYFYKHFYRRLFNKPVLTCKVLLEDNFNVGKHSYGVPSIFYSDSGRQLVIGNYCSIGERVTIFLGGNHRTDWVTTYPFNDFKHHFSSGISVKGHPSSKGDVIIGNDVWIGYGATILSGVTIGDGAVIAAMSVVARDIPAYSIAGGNPAKVIKQRFGEETIRQLLRIRWWEWEDQKVNGNVHLLCTDRIAEFISDH